jgi:hypothetical protein
MRNDVHTDVVVTVREHFRLGCGFVEQQAAQAFGNSRRLAESMKFH